jgi:hypothetical protein
LDEIPIQEQGFKPYFSTDEVLLELLIIKCIATRITITTPKNMNGIYILKDNGSAKVVNWRCTNRKNKLIIPNFEMKLMVSFTERS